MLLSRELRSGAPRLLRRSKKNSGYFVPSDYQRETPDWPVHQRSRAVDDRPHRSVARADDSIVRDQGAEPVGKVDDLGTGDAWKQILVAPGKTHYLVGKHRAADQDLIVVED